MTSVEAKEIQFEYPVGIIARNVSDSIGELAESEKIKPIPTHFKHLDKQLTEHKRKYLGLATVPIPMFVISGLQGLKIDEDEGLFPGEEISYTVAEAILTNRESLQDLPDLQLRALLDASLGVAVSNYQDQLAYYRWLDFYGNAAFKQDALRHIPFLEEHLGEYISYQDKLRKPVPNSIGVERK